MFIISIISGLLFLTLLVVGIGAKLNHSYWWTDKMTLYVWWWIFLFVSLVVWLISFMVALNWTLSSRNLTGYIYSMKSTYGYTVGDIRFSEQAGIDKQPSFCVKSDSEAGRQIERLVGSGKKVSIYIPTYFYFANNPFACGTTNTIITEEE